MVSYYTLINCEESYVSYKDIKQFVDAEIPIHIKCSTSDDDFYRYIFNEVPRLQKYFLVKKKCVKKYTNQF